MKHLKLYLLVAYALVIALGVWQAIPALKTKGQTGVLTISANSASAQISISQENHQARIVGTGNATVRLNPGTYQIVATGSGNRASAVVNVRKGQGSNSSLKLTSPPHQRTIADVNFGGMDNLINVGVTNEQVTEMEQYIYQYKPNAKTVTVLAGSVSTGPRDPNVVSPFVQNFKLSIDGTTYIAAISYMDLNNVELQIYDFSTGSQLFSAGTNGS